MPSSWCDALSELVASSTAPDRPRALTTSLVETRQGAGSDSAVPTGGGGSDGGGGGASDLMLGSRFGTVASCGRDGWGLSARPSAVAVAAASTKSRLASGPTAVTVGSDDVEASGSVTMLSDALGGSPPSCAPTCTSACAPASCAPSCWREASCWRASSSRESERARASCSSRSSSSEGVREPRTSPRERAPEDPASPASAAPRRCAWPWPPSCMA
mmetsp:Transcript_10713/g.27475  ORF Transcript_10713/g.27475 Transcript_10713/m.27475 type:complete len:216 (-) Transcript_10713:65-712(-)